MKTIAFKFDGKGGEYIRGTIAPVNRSEQTHFGLLDAAVVGFFLMCVFGLMYFVLR